MTRGALVIHGLTGTPATVASLSKALERAGFAVETPLLAGHGTSIEDLAGRRREEWYKSVCDAYDRLKTDEVFCAGLSLGSLLTLKLALDGARPVKKIACIGTPLRLSPLVEKLLLPIVGLPPLKYFVKNSGKDWKASVADEAGRAEYRRASYPKIPLASVWELKKLQREVLSGLPRLKIATLLIHARRDKVAPPFNVELFLKMVVNPPLPPFSARGGSAFGGSKGGMGGLVKVLWLERSEHVVTLDLERDQAAECVVRFFSLT